jgi:outer membrane protein assembly factor BamE (lipoprotein component of BamABCDE complex)
MRRVMMMMAVMVSVAAALVVMGCATAEMGRKFDTAAADRIEIGKTTEAEVLAWLGEPIKKMVMPNGSKIYAYSYMKSQAQKGLLGIHGEGGRNQLIVVINKQGVVASFDKSSMPMTFGPGMGKQ